MFTNDLYQFLHAQIGSRFRRYSFRFGRRAQTGRQFVAGCFVMLHALAAFTMPRTVLCARAIDGVIWKGRIDDCKLMIYDFKVLASDRIYPILRDVKIR